MMLAAPLALAFVGQPRARWRSRRVALGLSLLVMSALTAGVEREIFEAVVRFNDDLPQFAILDRDDASPRRTTTAARAAEYLPILYSARAIGLRTSVPKR